MKELMGVFRMYIANKSDDEQHPRLRIVSIAFCALHAKIKESIKVAICDVLLLDPGDIGNLQHGTIALSNAIAKVQIKFGLPLYRFFYRKLQAYYDCEQIYDIFKMAQYGIKPTLITLGTNLYFTQLEHYNTFVQLHAKSIADQLDGMVEINAWLYKRHIATTHIQRCWRECISNPSYKVCRKRLQMEFEEMSTT